MATLHCNSSLRATHTPALTLPQSPLYSSTADAHVESGRPYILRNLLHSHAAIPYRIWLGATFTNAKAYRLIMADVQTWGSCASKEIIEHVLCTCPEYDVCQIYPWTALNWLDCRTFSESRKYSSTVTTSFDAAEKINKRARALLKFMNFAAISGYSLPLYALPFPLAPV